MAWVGQLWRKTDSPEGLQTSDSFRNARRFSSLSNPSPYPPAPRLGDATVFGNEFSKFSEIHNDIGAFICILIAY